MAMFEFGADTRRGTSEALSAARSEGGIGGSVRALVLEGSVAELEEVVEEEL